ncbi:unnamed protein product [Zymoseptoria tritici ST99CH_3D1]|nr:unnamed protein product [Zymoseptoria tritici ST99CH_3D1]
MRAWNVSCGMEFPIDKTAVRIAVELQDGMKMLELFLCSAWDVDMQLEPEVPSALALALRRQDYQCANWLLDHGAYPNTKCTYDITPLSFAIQYSTVPFIQRVLDMGADILHCQAVHYAVYLTLPDYIDVLNFVLS